VATNVICKPTLCKTTPKPIAAIAKAIKTSIKVNPLFLETQSSPARFTY